MFSRTSYRKSLVTLRLVTLVILTGLTGFLVAGCQPKADLQALSPEEQFAAAELAYPAVAEYLADSRTFFDEAAQAQPLDDHIPGLVVPTPELAERLREGIALSQCVRGPSGQCIRIECDFDTDCDEACSGRQDVQLSICLALCRHRVQRSCRVILY